MLPCADTETSTIAMNGVKRALIDGDVWVGYYVAGLFAVSPQIIWTQTCPTGEAEIEQKQYDLELRAEDVQLQSDHYAIVVFN
jgi:hypothetical protein